MSIIHPTYEKGVSFIWDKACQEAFSKILKNISPSQQSCGSHIRKTILAYVRAMDHSLGALLTQKNDEGHEQAIYYLSGTLIGAESQYNPITVSYTHLTLPTIYSV